MQENLVNALEAAISQNKQSNVIPEVPTTLNLPFGPEVDTTREDIPDSPPNDQPFNRGAVRPWVAPGRTGNEGRYNKL